MRFPTSLSHEHRSVVVLIGGLALASAGVASSALIARPSLPASIAIAKDQARIAASPLPLAESETAPIEPAATVAPIIIASLEPPQAPSIMPPRPAAQTADEYLCEVYHRTPVKRDRSGDFTWKDKAAAKRMGKGLCDYVIGGMDKGFRERLAALGRQLDANHGGWSMLSAFRDPYRQGIASGFKASRCGSWHGGRTCTNSYGHGRAVDVSCRDGTLNCPVLHAIDRLARAFGLIRPMPGVDPAHVQLAGGGRGHIKVAKRHKSKAHRTRIVRRHHPRRHRRV